MKGRGFALLMVALVLGALLATTVFAAQPAQSAELPGVDWFAVVLGLVIMIAGGVLVLLVLRRKREL